MGDTVVSKVELVTEAILLASVRQADTEMLKCCTCRDESTRRFLLYGMIGHNKQVVEIVAKYEKLERPLELPAAETAVQHAAAADTRMRGDLHSLCATCKLRS